MLYLNTSSILLFQLNGTLPIFGCFEITAHTSDFSLSLPSSYSHPFTSLPISLLILLGLLTESRILILSDISQIILHRQCDRVVQFLELVKHCIQQAIPHVNFCQCQSIIYLFTMVLFYTREGLQVFTKTHPLDQMILSTTGSHQKKALIRM